MGQRPKETLDKTVIGELCRCFSRRQDAERLLAEIGFPASRQPVFENPQVFWFEVVRLLSMGVIADPDPLHRLRKAAASSLPGNRVFAPVVAQPRPASLVAPSQTRVVSGDPTCRPSRVSGQFDAVQSPLRMTTLAQTWVRRLQAHAGLSHDAFIVINGPAQLIGQRILLDNHSRAVQITRGPCQADEPPGPTIKLDSSYVSRPHAVLTSTRDGWHLIPESEQCRVYVGTVRVQRHRLVYGDEVRIGDFVLLFVPAELDQVPIQVVDLETGLLQARVFLAEVSRIADRRASGGAPDLGVILIRVEGLRPAGMGLEVTPLPGSRGTLSGKVPPLTLLGRSLLQNVADGVPLARLETNLFALALPEVEPDTLADEARRLHRLVLEVGLPHRLGSPTVVWGARQGRSLSGYQMLSCAVSSLDVLPAGHEGSIEEADLDVSGTLLRDEELLAVLVKTRARRLVVVGIQDEDLLRIQLGNQRLAGLRWSLQKAVRRAAPKGSVVGPLADEVFVIQVRSKAEEAQTAHRLKQEFAGYSEYPIEINTLYSNSSFEDLPGLRRRIFTVAATGEAENALSSEAPDRLPAAAVDRLPAPVAGPYGLIWVVTTESGRARAQLNAATGMVRFVGLALLSAVANHGELSAVDRGWIRDRQGQPLSSKQWVELAQWAEPGLVRCDHPVAAQVATLLAQGFVAQATDVLKPYWGAHEADTLDTCRSAFTEQLGPSMASVNRLMQTMTPLREVGLLALVNQRRKRSINKLTIRLLSGARENFDVRSVDSQEEELFDEFCYLATHDYKAFLELEPLLKLRPCPRCGREELFIARGIPQPDQEMAFVGITTGHRWAWAPDENSFSPALLELLS